MRSGQWITVAAVGLLAAGAARLGSAAPPPIEAYAQQPAMIDVDLNPAGTRLAWIEDDGRTKRIVIHDLTTHKNLRVLAVPEPARVRGVYWASDDTVLTDQRIKHSVDRTGRDADEWQRWVALDAAGGPERILLMEGGSRDWVTGADLVRRYTAKPGKVHMSTLDYLAANYRSETGSRITHKKKDDGWVSVLFEVDVKSGAVRRLESGSPFTIDWLTDAAAEHIVRSDWDPKTDEFSIRVRDSRGWHTLYESGECGRLSLITMSEDNTAIVARGATCTDARSKLWSLPLDGTPLKTLLDDPELEVERVIVDPIDRKLLAVNLGGATQPTRWLDATAERRSAGLHKSLAARTVTIVSRSGDARRVVALAESASHAPIYYLVDYNAKTADIINETYPLLNNVKLAPVREFHYEARDKYPLLAYLTIPADAAEKGLPVVVMPHGGPEARDELEFDWLVQFLASRGYAVLQPQFRGSSGFGRAHAEAGRRQWGLRMQDDVTDAVKALIETGIADPRRLCIVGWSYGGYAALAGAAFTPELYTCAASIAGVSDLPTMIGSVANLEGRESNSLAYWREHIGLVTDPQVIAKSPARNVTAIRAPILLLHGSDDTTVPIEQSRRMARALDEAKKKNQLVELPGDDHNLSSSETRVRMATELEKFLAAYLGAGALAADAKAAP